MDLDSERLEIRKFPAAENAYIDLLDAIAEIPEKEIDEKSAPFIAGVLLARKIEYFFLAAEEVEEKGATTGKKHIADLHTVLRNAQKGDFLKLRDFIKEEEREEEEFALDYDETDDAHRHLLNIRRKLERIGQHIPDRGDGKVIQVPNPSHTEDPIPFDILLERFRKGESVR